MKRSIFAITLIILLQVAVQAAALTDYNEMLRDSAVLGDLEQIKNALANGANVDFVDYVYNSDYYKHTALHLAVNNGHTETVNLLVQAKANLDSRNKDQLTPLHSAAHYGLTVIVKLLIQAKANIDAKDKNQFTPLHWAAYDGHADAVNILLKSGADHTLTTNTKSTLFDLIENRWIDQNKKDQITKIIQDFPKLLQDQIETDFLGLHEQNIPAPLAKIIAQYVCLDSENQKIKDRDKQ